MIIFYFLNNYYFVSFMLKNGHFFHFYVPGFRVWKNGGSPDSVSSANTTLTSFMLCFRVSWLMIIFKTLMLSHNIDSIIYILGIIVWMSVRSPNSVSSENPHFYLFQGVYRVEGLRLRVSISFEASSANLTQTCFEVQG